MKHLTFLLYILSRSISHPKPALIEALQDWPTTSPNIDLVNIEPVQFCKTLQLNKDQTAKFLSHFKTKAETEQLKEEFFKSLEQNDIQAINLFALSYPSQLLQIPDPPLILYVRGNNIKLLESTSLAMVGSRRASGYGKLVVDKLVGSLTGSDLTIISGLAYGIDSLSHQASMKNKLSTIAVLGSGVDDETIYPRANFNLAKDILMNEGLLVSECPPYTPAMNYQFVARNRIIAGLAQATVIVEAAARSGALLTADFAMDFNRTVFAVPGQIFSPQSAGTNHLIQQGAQMLSTEIDLLNEFNIDPKTVAATNIQFSNEQLAVLKCMRRGGETIELEDLVQKSGLQLGQVLSALTELELNKVVAQPRPQVYQKL